MARAPAGFVSRHGRKDAHPVYTRTVRSSPAAPAVVTTKLEVAEEQQKMADAQRVYGREGTPNTLAAKGFTPKVGDPVWFYDQGGRLRLGTRYRTALAEGGIIYVQTSDGEPHVVKAPGTHIFGQEGPEPISEMARLPPKAGSFSKPPPSKEEIVSYEKAQALHERRSPHAIAIDDALKAKTRFPKGEEDYTEWTKKKNRSDIQGIDVEVPRTRDTTPETAAEAANAPASVTPVGLKEPTPQELLDHPIVLRGDPKLVAKLQPIMDEKYGDLKQHKLNTRVVQVSEDSSLEKKGVSGYYRMKFVYKATGEPVHETVRASDLESGKVIAVPDRIWLAPERKSAEEKSTFIHESAHLRQHVQSDAKLRTSLTDADQEEREVVLEQNARSGAILTRDTSNPAYYVYYLKKHPDEKYPQVALDDQETIGTYSEKGITDTNMIETAIIERKRDTKLAKQLIAHTGALRGRRFKGKELGDPEDVDQVLVTSRGNYFHVYSPAGTTTPKVAAHLVDASDGKLHDERVYEVDDKGREHRVRD
jgi:hypothetical protein